MCDNYWDLPKSRRCAEHQGLKPHGFDPEVSAAVIAALGELIDAYGMKAVKTHVISELDIGEMDVV